MLWHSAVVTGADPTAADVPPSWRITGLQRWLPVFLTATFAAQVLLRVVELVTEPPPHVGDWIQLALVSVGAACMGTLGILTRRTRVTLTPSGVEVRSARSRLVPYATIDRAHRSRWSRGTVTLDLLDASTVVLPAPVAALKDPAPELDEAVDEINARVRAARARVEDERRE